MKKLLIAMLENLRNRIRTAFDLQIRQIWNVECWHHFHDDGSRCRTPHDRCPLPHVARLAWATEYKNLVPTVMLDKYLDATLKTGLASPLWYVGLVDDASFIAYAAGDLMSSHAGWVEGTPYSNSTRPAFTPGTIASGSVSNSASKAVFNINATLTIRGAFLIDDDTPGGSTGDLGGEGDFTGGSKAVSSGDTVNVQIICSIASV